jgi:hypothetical protein
MTTVLRDKQQARLIVRVLLQVGDCSYPLGDAAFAYEVPAMRAVLTPTPPSETVSSVPPDLLAPALRERIASLCSRLGIAEPTYDQLEPTTAETLLAQLLADEEELQQATEQVQASSAPAYMAPPIEKALLRQLKERWRTRFRPQGSLDDVLYVWEDFKRRICGETVSDRSMRADQYERLLTVLTSSAAERTPTR